MEVNVKEKKETAMSALDKFTFDLVERHAFQKLGTEAIAVLLGIHHQFSMTEMLDELSGENSRGTTTVETLKELIKLDSNVIERGLNALYLNGYLSKESFIKDGSSVDAYKLREKTWLYASTGEVVGELSWEKHFPSKLANIAELKNLVASNTFGDARVVHIENLQINVGNSSVNDALSGLEKVEDTIDVKEKEKEFNSPEAESATSDRTKTFLESTSTDLLIEEESSVKKSAVVSSVFEKKGHNEQSLNHIYQSYVDRLYRDFATALESAEQLAENARNECLAHEQTQPKQPIGLGLLINGRRWQKKMDDWNRSKANLDQNYQDCLNERNRLLNAMKPGANGEAPVYVIEAVQQLKQDHPTLAEEIDSRYSLSA